MADNPKDYLRTKYFDLGFQYYIVARFAASEGAALSPVLGNLFHHAIEMFLKGELCKRSTEQERRKLKHNLQAIWHTFKTESGGTSLDRFDSTIKRLHQFETIRYPEKIVSHGMTCTVAFGREPPIILSGSGTHYQIVVGEIDALVRAIVDAARVNPRFLAMKYRKHALKYLKRYNRSKATRLW